MPRVNIFFISFLKCYKFYKHMLYLNCHHHYRYFEIHTQTLKLMKGVFTDAYMHLELVTDKTN